MNASTSQTLRRLEKQFSSDDHNAAYAAEQVVLAATRQFVALVEAVEVFAKANPPKHDPPCGLGSCSSCSFHLALSALEAALHTEPLL